MCSPGLPSTKSYKELKTLLLGYFKPKVNKVNPALPFPQVAARTRRVGERIHEGTLANGVGVRVWRVPRWCAARSTCPWIGLRQGARLVLSSHQPDARESIRTGIRDGGGARRPDVVATDKCCAIQINIWADSGQDLLEAIYQTQVDCSSARTAKSKRHAQ